MLKKESGIPVLFVPGNHDYWSKDDGITDTWNICRQFQSFEGCLSERPYQINQDWAVIGNSGWYDYTMGEPEYTFDQFERMHAMDRTWQDSIYVRWSMSNRDIHRYFYDQMERELAEISSSSVIMVTHMLAHPYFKVPSRIPRGRISMPLWEVGTMQNSTGNMEFDMALWATCITGKDIWS